jgi:hypothetical protein
MTKSSRTLAAGIASLTLAGCASVVNHASQVVRVDAKTATGETIAGADCVAFNDRGVVKMKSGDPQSIRRSPYNLHVVCTREGLPAALGTATSRANAGMGGNILVGGLVGAAIDHSRGTGYTYPGWVQVVFGEALLFDQWMETAGQPLAGYAAGTEPPAPSSSAPVSQACQQQVQGFRCPRP